MVESIKELRKICQTKKQPLYMRLVSMRISIYITKLLLYTKVSADYVTMSMIVLLFAGSVLMATGSLMSIFIGILIIHFTIILDNVNGEVARYWKEDGLIGTFLEQVYHNLLVPFMFFSLAFGIFLATGSKYVLVFGFLAAVFGLPVIIKSIKDAVIEERLGEIDKGKKLKINVVGKTRIQGGVSSFGNLLYSLYGKFRAVWVYPANIVHITFISVIELASAAYGLFQPYVLLSYYIYIYGLVSIIIQAAAFAVNYKGRTFDHYYKELFGRR